MPSQRSMPFRAAMTAVLLCGAWPQVLSAQAAGGPYTLRESVIAGAGVQVQAGGFRAALTAGQPAVGPVAAGRFRLFGGFHRPATRSIPLFRDGFEPAPAVLPSHLSPLSFRGETP